MKYWLKPLPPGSLHMRVYKDEDDISTMPPYLYHTILAPCEGGGCDVVGLTEINLESRRLLESAVREAGFKFFRYRRYKDGKPIEIRKDV